MPVKTPCLLLDPVGIRLFQLRRDLGRNFDTWTGQNPFHARFRTVPPLCRIPLHEFRMFTFDHKGNTFWLNRNFLRPSILYPDKFPRTISSQTRRTWIRPCQCHFPNALVRSRATYICPYRSVTLTKSSTPARTRGRGAISRSFVIASSNPLRSYCASHINLSFARRT